MYAIPRILTGILSMLLAIITLVLVFGVVKDPKFENKIVYGVLMILCLVFIPKIILILLGI